MPDDFLGETLEFGRSPPTGGAALNHASHAFKNGLPFLGNLFGAFASGAQGRGDLTRF